MTTQETALFMRDRAKALRFEALRHPHTASMCAAWLCLAAAWAARNGLPELAQSMSNKQI